MAMAAAIGIGGAVFVGVGILANVAGCGAVLVIGLIGNTFPINPGSISTGLNCADRQYKEAGSEQSKYGEV